MSSKDSEMVVTTETPFHLLSLPPELWSRICRLAVTRQNPILFSEAMSPQEVETLVKQPAITLVCKTIREETIDLFYANSFVFVDTEKPERKFWIWLHALRVGDRIKYRMPDLSIRSRFCLDAHPRTRVNRELGRVGLSMQRVGEKEPGSTSARSYTVYKVVPTPG
ncbi:hypothetical protein LTR17_004713 [Elasticomyces elasticus]|nr:hypothetical protein LTR17_004713 [Elasticomyces elasticus]